MWKKWRQRIQSFFNIALGSASETEYLLILSKDLNYISKESFEILDQEINNIIK